ncbi:hypothetical protein TSUD_385250, partial [Trifolium subterraneum]
MGLDKCKGSVEVLDSSVHEVIDENLSNFVEGVGDVGTSREVSKDLGSNKELNETAEEVKVQEKRDELPVVDQGTSYSSSNLVNHGVVETVVVIDAVNVQTEGMKLETKADESGLSLVSMKAPKGVCETDKDSCVIDMKCSSHKGYAKYVARLQKMFLLFLIMDLWKGGMIEDSWTTTPTHPSKGLVDAGEDSHF